MTKEIQVIRDLFPYGTQKSAPGNYAVVTRTYKKQRLLHEIVRAKAQELGMLERATASHIWLTSGYHLIFCTHSNWINTIERTMGTKLQGFLLAEEDPELFEYLLSRMR